MLCHRVRRCQEGSVLFGVSQGEVGGEERGVGAWEPLSRMSGGGGENDAFPLLNGDGGDTCSWCSYVRYAVVRKGERAR